jgi:hypothetical protein
METLPYRIRTKTGGVYDFDFPLHRETGNPQMVGRLVSQMLDAVDRELAEQNEASNGDVLQAIAMAMACRARMIHAKSGTVEGLCRSLLDTALGAAVAAADSSLPTGHA